MGTIAGSDLRSRKFTVCAVASSRFAQSQVHGLRRRKFTVCAVAGSRFVRSQLHGLRRRRFTVCAVADSRSAPPPPSVRRLMLADVGKARAGAKPDEGVRIRRASTVPVLREAAPSFCRVPRPSGGIYLRGPCAGPPRAVFTFTSVERQA
jgi:hypothetical protein